MQKHGMLEFVLAKQNTDSADVLRGECMSSAAPLHVRLSCTKVLNTQAPRLFEKHRSSSCYGQESICSLTRRLHMQSASEDGFGVA